MLKKLLNKNNLIIMIIVLCLGILAIPNIVYATTYPLSDYLKETIAAWYVFIKYFCLAVMFIVFISLGIKAAVSSVAEEKSKFKEMIIYWIIGLILLFMLEDIIYAIIHVEQLIVDKLGEIGREIVGGSTSDQQVSLYESARTKAYEIKFSSGMLGLFMYIILVYYTFKFFVVYVKRYLNVMILILVSPIVMVMYTFRKVFQGKGGIIGRWFKELLYNVFIQVVHAATYSILVGFSLSLSDNVLSFIGAILTFLAFFFMFKLDGIIRKIFNFVGGKSTIEVRDYASVIKHPVESFEESKGYFKETLPQEIQSKADGLVEKLTPENISAVSVKFAHNFANEAKETMAALDGKRIKVSQEAIQKEQEKINHPKLPQKVLNTIQGVALGATQLAITGVETIAKKTKEKIKKLKEATKGAREELNQDFEVVKRFTKILKYHVVRKKIEEKAENEEEQPAEIQLEATVINLLETEFEEASELKLEITKNDATDMVAAAYRIYGPAVFIYQNISSCYMGMSVLASAKYEQKAISQKQIQDNTDKKIIRFPFGQLKRNKLNQKLKKGQRTFLKKKYKFKRFNRASIITITRNLNRRFVISNEYLSNIYQVGQMVVNGDAQVSGSYIPKGKTKIKRTSIKYTAKMKSDEMHQTTANIEFARYAPSQVKEEKPGEQKGKIIYFKPIQERKQQAQAIVQTYHDRVQDSIWAVLEGTATDAREMHTQRITTSVQTVRQRTSAAVVLQQMTDMGIASKINEDLYVVFSDQSITDSGEILQLDAQDEEYVTQGIIDSSITDLAIKYDIPLEKIDLIRNKGMQEEILQVLTEKGVVEYSEATSEDGQQNIIKSLEKRKRKIVREEKKEYVKNVMQKTAAKLFVQAVDTGDAVADKVSNVGTQVKDVVKNSKLVDNKFVKAIADSGYPELLNQIAQNAVQVEADRVKQELIDQVQAAVDATKEYVKTGKEVYGVSKEDFKRKGEQIKNDIQEGAKEFAEGVADTAEKIAKSALDAAIDPFRIAPRKGKRKGEEYASDEAFIFYIMGAVVSEGRYELPIGSRIYDAIKAAGGPTDEADLSAIPYYDPIKNGETIYIPKRSNDDMEKILEKCKPVVEKVIKDYIVENNISNIDSLKKLVHKKTILSKLQRALAEENITSNQIEELFEKRIKELKYIRESLKNATKDMRVVDKAKIVAQESENVEQDRKRQETGAKNSEEISLDNALKKLHELSDSESSESDSDSEDEPMEEQNQDILMNQLLMQLETQKEKVLVPARNEEGQQDGNSGKYAARRYLTMNPDDMMNKMLGRI